MRIRKYMVIGVLFILVLPWFVYFGIHLFDACPWLKQSGSQDAIQMQLIQTIAQHEGQWTDSKWQADLKSTLQHEGMEAVIRSPSNGVIFQFAQHGHNRWIQNQQVLLMQNGRSVGSVQLFEPGKADPVAALGAILTAILAILFVGFQVGRNVIHPLESMAQAALQIAEGDLDFELATSQTVEIRRVRAAFLVMGKGLRDAFAKQQALEEERKFFIGAIAHDLRTPLFTLRGYLDGIEQGIAATPEKLTHYVAVCQEKAEHLERLIADLFAVTRLEYMEQTLQCEPVDLTELVGRTIASVAGQAREKGVALELNAPRARYMISGDPHLLERAITNVLDNAIRYTPRDGTVTVILLRETEKVVITIRDTGPGFSTKDVDRMFEPMVRGDASRNVKTGGAGLGLTIARRILRAHGGELSAGNAPGGGAELTGWIPLVGDA